MTPKESGDMQVNTVHPMVRTHPETGRKALFLGHRVAQFDGMTPAESAPRTIAVVTGTRADYGLLRPVMRAIADSDPLALRVIRTGTHLLGPHPTGAEVAADFEIEADVRMQTEGASGRFGDAAAFGRGITGMTEVLDRTRPDVVLVLGDRIEAFAAAAASSGAADQNHPVANASALSTVKTTIKDVVETAKHIIFHQ